MPWFMAGNANGYFKTGRHVATGRDVAQNGRFVSILHAFGLVPPDDTFGDPKFGLGELPGLRA
jgi:hypothetical protein